MPIHSIVDDISSVSCNNVRFELLKNKKGGRLKFTLEARTDMGTETEKLSLPITCIWVGKQCYAVRCFASTRSRRGKFLMQLISMFGMLPTDRYGMVMAGTGDTLVYGVRPDAPYTEEDESYSVKTYYPTKAAVLNAMLEYVARYHQVVGFESLNVVPDAIVKQFGFEEVPEYFGRGPSMWIADPSSVVGTSYDSTIKKKALLLLRIMQYVVEKRNLKELTMEDLG